jgi:hypothetical protein
MVNVHCIGFTTLHCIHPPSTLSNYYFVLLVGFTFFCSIFSMFCEFASYFVHHPNHTTKVAHPDCTTNVSHHPSQMMYIILF